jgi:5-amino-6-(5-phosphoribosylamino)uracil reductase
MIFSDMSFASFVRMNNQPKTTVVLAMTADGKIADRKRSPARFGSGIDKMHLEEQVSLVDAVIFGANTLRAYGTTLSVTNPQLLAARKMRCALQGQSPSQSPQPVQIVVSASGDIDSQLPFFAQPIPRWLLTLPTGAELWRKKPGFERIVIANCTKEDHSAIDWVSTLIQLGELGIEKLAILGGGELVASLLAVDLIDELWLTVCPVIFGGNNSPTPVAGIGFIQSHAKQLELLEVKQVDGEVFLHYLVKRDRT